MESDTIMTCRNKHFPFTSTECSLSYSGGGLEHQSVKVNSRAWRRWAYKSFHHFTILVYFHLNYSSDKKVMWMCILVVIRCSAKARDELENTKEESLENEIISRSFECLWKLSALAFRLTFIQLQRSWAHTTVLCRRDICPFWIKPRKIWES